MQTETISSFTIKDGDIFRWKYADEKPEHLGSWGRYHCKSQIAIANDGRLQDTYWNLGSDSSWGYEEALSKLKLVYLGNFADLEAKERYMSEYYDVADCVDISHPNSSRGNFYVRKGAKRSEQKMREVLVYKIEKKEREVESAKWSIELMKKELAKIDAGEPLDTVYL